MASMPVQRTGDALVERAAAAVSQTISSALISVFGTYQTEDAPEPAEDFGTLREQGWRTEIIGNGKYYTWRKGSHGKRQSARGGKFSPGDFGTGYAERREAYEQNKAIHQERRGQGPHLDAGAGA